MLKSNKKINTCKKLCYNDTYEKKENEGENIYGTHSNRN
jgi:hypothetical protein